MHDRRETGGLFAGLFALYFVEKKNDETEDIWYTGVAY